MAFYGKQFVVEKEENFEEFVKSLGLPEERSKNILQYKPSQKLEKDGDEYTLTVTTNNVEKIYKFKSGVEFADTFRDLNVKITITVDGYKVTHVMKYEIGFTLTIKKEYTDDSLVEEMTHSQWDGVARKFYKAQ